MNSLVSTLTSDYAYSYITISILLSLYSATIKSWYAQVFIYSQKNYLMKL